MAETPRHRMIMTDTIATLEVWFADDPRVYISGNMFIYYEPGNRRRHVSPDVFAAKDVPKNPTPERRRYLVWEEGKGPDVVVEISSESTRDEDLDDKFAIYQNILKVKEYFLFDPYGEYLQPALQGYRLQRGHYVRIKPVKGRLPSQVLGLHLEAHDVQLRLYNPATRTWLPTPAERAEAAEADQQREATARQQAEAEVVRLRRELDALRQRLPEQR